MTIVITHEMSVVRRSTPRFAHDPADRWSRSSRTHARQSEFSVNQEARPLPDVDPDPLAAFHLNDIYFTSRPWDPNGIEGGGARRRNSRRDISGGAFSSPSAKSGRWERLLAIAPDKVAVALAFAADNIHAEVRS